MESVSILQYIPTTSRGKVEKPRLIKALKTKSVFKPYLAGYRVEVKEDDIIQRTFMLMLCCVHSTGFAPHSEEQHSHLN